MNMAFEIRFQITAEFQISVKTPVTLYVALQIILSEY